MNDLLLAKEKLLNIVEQLNEKYIMSKSITEDYFEPGMMENLEQYKGEYDKENNTIILRTEVKGLRYDNRTTNLEKISIDDSVLLVREENNPYNYNNFAINSIENKSLGNLPAELCNALSPLYDLGYAKIISTTVSYIEKIKERSRYAKQGILFVEIKILLRGI